MWLGKHWGNPDVQMPIPRTNCPTIAVDDRLMLFAALWKPATSRELQKIDAANLPLCSETILG